VRLAVLLARLARELDAARREEGAAGGGVDHLDEPLFGYTHVSLRLYVHLGQQNTHTARS